METRVRLGVASLLGAAVLLLGGTSSVYAIGGDDAATTNKVNKETQNCQKEIAAKGQKYWEKAVKALNQCADATQKCDEQSNASKAADCRTKLIEDNKGKCARGKLGSTKTTAGAGQALASKTKSDKPTLDKEMAKYRDAVKKKCFDTANVDLTSVTQGLGFGAAADANALVGDQINADQTGVTCLAQQALLDSTPTIRGASASSSILLTLRALEDGTHHLAEILNEIQDQTRCQ